MFYSTTQIVCRVHTCLEYPPDDVILNFSKKKLLLFSRTLNRMTDVYVTSTLRLAINSTENDMRRVYLFGLLNLCYKFS